MPREHCPSCGTAISPNARSCPECGAAEQTGWNADTGSLGLPDEDFNYDEFIENEFDDDRPQLKPRGLHWFWWLAGILLLAALIFRWVL